MSTTNNLFKIIREGQAQLHVPKTVFYNPVQEFNRDLSVLVLKTYLKHNVWHYKNEERHIKARGGVKILDALSASGLRSIRYAKELGSSSEIVDKIVANDLSDVAVDLIQKNIELNNVKDKVTCSHSDAIHLLNMSSRSFDQRFHVIDLDPFGTGAQFFDAAVRSIGEAGLLMVTCTDVAVLCGNASESCFARYGSMSVRADFCHEAALRIVLRSLEQHAAVYGRYIKPLYSISVDFYVRVFIQVFTQQAETKKSASKLSQLFLCKECKTHEFNTLGSYEIKDDAKQAESKNPAVRYKFKSSEMQIGDRCKICSGKYTIAGPIWSDPIHDNNFLKLLKQELDFEETQKQLNTFKRIQGLVYICSEELGSPPLFHSTNNISSVLKKKMPRIKDVLSALVNAGYEVSGTHCYQYGFKTTAPSNVVWDVFCQHAERDIESKEEFVDHRGDESSVAVRIMKRPDRVKTFDFTYNPKIETESQRLSLVRFQVNPAKEWGPKSRPAAKEQQCEQTSAKRTTEDNKSLLAEQVEDGDRNDDSHYRANESAGAADRQKLNMEVEQEQQASKKRKLEQHEHEEIKTCDSN